MKSIWLLLFLISLNKNVIAEPAVRTQTNFETSDLAIEECVDTYGGYNYVRQLAHEIDNDAPHLRHSKGQIETNLDRLDIQSVRDTLITIDEYKVNLNGIPVLGNSEYIECDKITSLDTDDLNTTFLDFIHRVSMHGENDIWAAPDELACLPWTYNPDTGVCGEKVDAQLSNLIKRTGFVASPPKQGGTVLLMGPKCDTILGANHTMNNPDGSMYAESRGKKTDFIRNQVENGKKMRGIKGIDWIYVDNYEVSPWTKSSDRKITYLEESAKDQVLKSCPPVPVLDTDELLGSLNKIKKCLLIAYNVDSRNPSKSRESEMTLRTYEGLKDVPAGTRGITECNIGSIREDGLFRTNCDSVNESSGGSLFCNMGKEWSLVGNIYGTNCTDNYNECFNPKKIGRPSNNDTLLIPIPKKFKITLEKYNN